MSDDRVPHPRSPPGLIPNPDPSLLTTVQTDQKIAGLREILETRLDAGDKALILLQKNHDLIPGMMEKQADQRDKLNNEKFSGLQRQIDQIGVLAKAVEAAANLALNTALTSQKEAVGIQNANLNSAVQKLEGVMTKQIESNQAITNTKIDAMTSTINTILGWQNRMEGKSNGFSSNMTTGISIAALLAAVVLGMINLMMKTQGSDNGVRGTAAALTVPAVPLVPR